MVSRRGVSWIAILAACWAGCDRTAEVAHYQVPSDATSPAAESEPPAAHPAIAYRMLAAIVPVDGQAWFFKAMGPVESVNQKAAEFDKLLESVKFDSANQPRWTLPEGWTEQPGNQFRYATLMAGDLEVTVSTLPAPNGIASPKYILENVNRWRDQLQLSTLPSVDQLEQTVTRVPIGDRESYRVDLTGMASPTATMRGPFQTAAGGGPFGAEGPSAPANDPAGAPVSSTAESSSGQRRVGGMSFTKPEQWQDGRSGGFRLAAFLVEQNGRTAEVTVIALGPASGSLLDNVNRWRGEINLSPINQAQLGSAVSDIKVDDVTGQYVRIHEADAKTSQATLVAILPRPDRTLFIKIKGPDDLVLAEEDAFKDFVQSIRFDS